MKLSNVSNTPCRPEVTRVGQKDLPSNQFDSSFASSSRRWFNNQKGRISPGTDTSWIDYQKSNDNNNNSEKLTKKTWFWILMAIILLLIVGAIIGIVLGLTLPSSATTTSSTTMPTSMSTTNGITGSSTAAAASTASVTPIACSNTGRGLLAFQNRSTPFVWTPYSYTFSTTKTAPTLVFGFETDGTNRFYLDAIVLVNNNAASTQLLTNPSFENSTATPTGWITSCEIANCGGTAASIVTGSCLTGNCFESFCTQGRRALIYLSQTFTTISGQPHTLNFSLTRTNIGSNGIMAFYLDVI